MFYVLGTLLRKFFEENFKLNWHLNIISNHSNEEAWSSEDKKIKFDVKIQDFTNSAKNLLI